MCFGDLEHFTFRYWILFDCSILFQKTCKLLSYKACAGFIKDMERLYKYSDMDIFPDSVFYRYNPMNNGQWGQESLTKARGNEVFKYAQFPYGFEFSAIQDSLGVVRPAKGPLEYKLQELRPGFPGPLVYEPWGNTSIWDLGKTGDCYSQLLDLGTDSYGLKAMEYCDASLSFLAGKRASPGLIKNLADDLEIHQHDENKMVSLDCSVWKPLL